MNKTYWVVSADDEMLLVSFWSFLLSITDVWICGAVVVWSWKVLMRATAGGENQRRTF